MCVCVCVCVCVFCFFLFLPKTDLDTRYNHLLEVHVYESGRFYGTSVPEVPGVAPSTPRGKGWRFKGNFSE